MGCGTSKVDAGVDVAGALGERPRPDDRDPAINANGVAAVSASSVASANREGEREAGRDGATAVKHAGNPTAQHAAASGPTRALHDSVLPVADPLGETWAPEATAAADPTADRNRPVVLPTADPEAEARLIRATRALLEALDPEADPRMHDMGATESVNADTGKSIVWPPFVPKQKSSKFETVRREILREAALIGKAREMLGLPPRTILLIYNPIAGGGISKIMVDHLVVPVFRLARIDFKLVRTEYQFFATTFMQTIIPGEIDGIAVAGGDGLVFECVTGYFRHKRAAELQRSVPLTIIATGTANAMGHELHSHTDFSQARMVGRAALAAAYGTTRGVDAIQVESPTLEPSYALSCVGWGICGAIAERAGKLRYMVPKRFRYDIASALQVMPMVQEWPFNVYCTLSYRLEPPGPGEDPDSARGWVVKDNFACLNFTATNMKMLGVGNPMHDSVEVDDGKIAMVWANPKVTRLQLARGKHGMNRGKPLADGPGMASELVSEFKIVPKKNPVRPKTKLNNGLFMIDGDPVESDEIHVKVLNKALPVFHIKPAEGAARDDGARSTDQQARDVLERLMAASDVELPALSLPSPVRPTQQLPPLQVDAAVKDQILRELKVRHYGRIAAVPDWVKISSRSYGTPLSTPQPTPASSPVPRRKQIGQSVQSPLASALSIGDVLATAVRQLDGAALGEGGAGPPSAADAVAQRPGERGAGVGDAGAGDAGARAVVSPYDGGGGRGHHRRGSGGGEPIPYNPGS